MDPKKEMETTKRLEGTDLDDQKSSSDAVSPAPGDTNLRSADFDMESKFSSDHDNNFEYRSEGVPNRKQQFKDFSKSPESKP